MNMKRTARWSALAALCGVVLLAACGGDNLFDAEQNPYIEPQVDVFAPDFVFAGDTVIVNVTASAALNLQSIAVIMRGAVNKDTLITTGSLRAISSSVKIGVPLVPTSNAVLISAQAADATGRLSRPAADTVQVFTQ